MVLLNGSPAALTVDVGRTTGEPTEAVTVAGDAAASGCGELELESPLVGGREAVRPCPGVDKRYVVIAGEVEFVRL